MRRWRWPIAFFLLCIISFFGLRHLAESRAQQKRELRYQSVLRAYSTTLKPGMTRQQVEEYLRSQSLTIRHMCCVEIKRYPDGAWDDLIKIGTEDVPWVCSENNVYVALQFAGQRYGGTGWDAQPSDKLKAISIYHWLEGCL